MTGEYVIEGLGAGRGCESPIYGGRAHSWDNWMGEGGRLWRSRRGGGRGKAYISFAERHCMLECVWRVKVLGDLFYKVGENTERQGDGNPP